MECLRLFIERFNRISQTWRNITICDLWNGKNLSIQPLISCINCVHFILIFFYIYFYFSIYSQFWSILNIFHLLFIRIIIQKENSKEISKFHRTIYVFTPTYFNFMTIIRYKYFPIIDAQVPLLIIFLYDKYIIVHNYNVYYTILIKFDSNVYQQISFLSKYSITSMHPLFLQSATGYLCTAKIKSTTNRSSRHSTFRWTRRITCLEYSDTIAHSQCNTIFV